MQYDTVIDNIQALHDERKRSYDNFTAQILAAQKELRSRVDEVTQFCCENTGSQSLRNTGVDMRTNLILRDKEDWSGMNEEQRKHATYLTLINKCPAFIIACGATKEDMRIEWIWHDNESEEDLTLLSFPAGILNDNNWEDTVLRLDAEYKATVAADAKSRRYYAYLNLAAEFAHPENHKTPDDAN